jgi:hypothetical protein
MIKRGVDVVGINPELVLAYCIAQQVYAEYGAECIITSVKEGKHGWGSLHYVGLAIDLRIRHLEEGHAELIAADLRDKLGPQFDCVLEKTHLHLELQPK